MELPKYRVERDERLGRYLVTRETLKRGSLIFTDVPFAIGPKPDSIPVCLGCHSIWNKTYYCSKCGWPCCNVECEEASTHKDFECRVFSEANEKFHHVADATKPCLQYDCITPLRVLLSKEKDPERWDKEVTVMEDHNADRRKRITWEVDDVNITKYLRGPCRLEDRFSEDLIQKVCGILEVNAVEVPFQYGPNIRGIYPRVAVMSHNCVPTVVHTIISGGKNGIPKNFAQVWAADEIKEGGKIELCYTQVFNCTLQRRAYLRRSKFFDCVCDRCADPTEFGTNLSTLKCNKCDTGLILPLDPLDDGGTWKCSECTYSTTGSSVLQVIDMIQTEMSRTEENAKGKDEIDKREQEIQWYRSILHPKHALLTCLKYTMAQMYGRVQGYTLEELTLPLLKRKMEMCRNILDVLDIICPGQTRMRGLMLYELQAPWLILTKIEYKEGSINKTQFNERMSQIAEMVHESAEILSREDENSDKGVIGRAAMKFYKDLITTI